MSDSYLPEGLPLPNTGDPLSAPYWEAARVNKLRIQKCRGCGAWQWGPEWICHRCHSFDLGWEDVAGHGRIVVNKNRNSRKRCIGRCPPD